MKLKTNKLLTLTLASSLVAITACGGGGTKATPTSSGGGGGGTPDPVTYAEWAAGTTQATVLDDNAFLASVTADADGLDIPTQTPPITPTVMTLNLNSQYAPADTTSGAELTEVRLGGEAADGVAFFTTGDAEAARYFAGLHFSTDLGVPVATSGATATWENGFFQAIGGTNAVAKSFSLTVNFVSAQVSGIVPIGTNTYGTDGDLSYFFVGDYDRDGVITGDIILRDLATDNADDAAARADGVVDLTAALVTGAASPATDGIGTLTGLIGVDGAIGAFYSTADGADGYAGGFVVSTEDNTGGTDPDVLYADWAAGATQAAVLTDNAFLASVTTDADGLVFPAPTTAPDVETLNLAAETHPAGTAKVDGVTGTVAMNAGTAGVNARTLGGVATNGVAFFTTGAADDARYFAGLHFGTDLGRPVLTSGTEATWNGLIQAVSGTTTSAFDAKIFELTVNFGTTDATRTISAHVAAGTVFTADSYYLSGTYDANGVITGTVSRGVIPDTDDGRTAATANGTLTGLIGLTGAVGAFHSTGTDGDGATGYAGGFVAIPTAIPDATADEPTPYAGDVVNYADLGVTPLSTYPTTAVNGFLGATTATALTGTPSAATTVSVDDDDVIGGALFFTNEIVSGTASFFAGIHSDTNLGSPITTTTGTAVWSGRFAAVGATGTYETIEKDIDLTIAFGSTDLTRTIQGSVPDGAAADTTFVASAPTYHINATFTALGVISGTIDYNSEATSAAGIALAVTDVSTGGPITGLIGQSGAVGAFHSTATGAAGFAGGFAVAPPASP